jgi:hypothetical protein
MYYYHMCEQNSLPALCRLKQVAIELGQCSERIERYTPSFTMIDLHLKHSVYIPHIAPTLTLRTSTSSPPTQRTQNDRCQLVGIIQDAVFLVWEGNRVCRYYRDEFNSAKVYNLSSVLVLHQQHTLLHATSIHGGLLNTALAYASQSTEQYRSSVSQLRYLPLSHPSLSLSLSLSKLFALCHTFFAHLENEGDWLCLNCIKSTQTDTLPSRKKPRARTLSQSMQVMHLPVTTRLTHRRSQFARPLRVRESRVQIYARIAIIHRVFLVIPRPYWQKLE